MMLNAVRFGWGGSGRAVDSVKNDAFITIAPDHIQWVPFQNGDPDFPDVNPEMLPISKRPVLAASVLQRIKACLTREGTDYLNKPGFVIMETPFPPGSQESPDYVYARLLAVDTVRRLRNDTEKTESLQKGWRYFTTDRSVGQVTPKSMTLTKPPHFDSDPKQPTIINRRLISLTYGPHRGFGPKNNESKSGYTGGNPRVVDALQYLSDNAIPKQDILNLPSQIEQDNALLEDLLSRYTIEHNLDQDKASIPVLITNNNVNQDNGVFHGSEPITFWPSSDNNADSQLQADAIRALYYTHTPLVSSAAVQSS